MQFLLSTMLLFFCNQTEQARRQLVQTAPVMNDPTLIAKVTAALPPLAAQSLADLFMNLKAWR